MIKIYKASKNEKHIFNALDYLGYVYSREKLVDSLHDKYEPSIYDNYNTFVESLVRDESLSENSIFTSELIVIKLESACVIEV